MHVHIQSVSVDVLSSEQANGQSERISHEHLPHFTLDVFWYCSNWNCLVIFHVRLKSRCLLLLLTVSRCLFIPWHGFSSDLVHRNLIETTILFSFKVLYSS